VQYNNTIISEQEQGNLTKDEQCGTKCIIRQNVNTEYMYMTSQT